MTNKTYTLVNGQPADATQVNKNFDDIIAGVGDISAAGHALLDDADAAAQRATLGGVVVGPASATDNAIVRADGVTGKLVQNSDVFIDDAGNFKFRSAGSGVDPLGNLDWGNVGNAAINARISALRGASNYGQGNLIFSTSPDDSGAVERMRIDMNGAVTIGGQVAVVTNDARLSDARPASDVSAWAKAGTKPSYTYGEVGAPSTSDARLSDARPASDVSAWAKAASNVAVPGAFGCNGKPARAAYPSTAPFGWGNGAFGFQTLDQLTAFVSRVYAIEAALVANGIMY